MTATYPLDQCALYKCQSKKRLNKVLGFSYKTALAYTGIQFYRVRKIQKDSNPLECRVVYAPHWKLKKAQARIKKLLERVQTPSWLYSGKKGVCHVDNARHHEGSPYVLTLDLASFFDACNRNAVYLFFRDKMKCAPDVASILTDLTTLGLQDGTCVIPTGSPSSQLVSYFAYEDMFEELHELAAAGELIISLYVDDITISSMSGFSNPKKLEERINQILRAYGHRLNRSKTRYSGKAAYSHVTGVALDGYGALHVENALRWKIITGMKAVLKGDPTPCEETMGRVFAARQIEPGVFPAVEQAINRMADGFGE